MKSVSLFSWSFVGAERRTAPSVPSGANCSDEEELTTGPAGEEPWSRASTSSRADPRRSQYRGLQGGRVQQQKDQQKEKQKEQQKEKQKQEQEQQ
jgi:hypothetical protein